MALIIFMLLVVIVLAVGVRVLEAGSKIGLAIALLLAVLFGFRLVSQHSARLAESQALQAAENVAEARAELGEVRDETKVDLPAEAADATATLSDRGETVSLQAERQPNGADGTDDGKTNGSEIDQFEIDELEIDDLKIQTVATKKRPVIPPRPDWVEAEPSRDGEVVLIAVASGPEERLKECRGALDTELERAVAEYIDEYLGQVYGEHFKASTLIEYDAKHIRKNLVDEDDYYEESLEMSFGPMYQTHALVKITPEFRAVLDGRRAECDEHWRQIVVFGRLSGAALVFGLVLAFLAVVSGYFRLDTATRGFYTARLQFLAAVAILAVIVAGALLAKNISWM